MIDLVYIKNDYYPNNMASAIQVMNTIYALASNGVSVHGFFKRKGNERARDVLEYYGLAHHDNLDIKLLYVPCFLSKNIIGDSYFTLSAIAFLLWKIGKKKADIVYCTGVSRYLSFLSSIKKMINLKIVSEMHQACLEQKTFKLIKKMYDKNVFDGIVTISHALKKEFVKRGIKSSCIEVAHSGVNPSVKQPNGRIDLINELGLPFSENEKIIIYAGHLYPSKGVDTLIKAFSRLNKIMPGARLVVLGGEDTRDLTRCKDLAVSLGMDSYIYFSGPIEPTKVKKYLYISDIGVLPTPNNDKDFWNFSSPLKLSEYMESGLPVVASNLECVSEKIKDGWNGILFTPSDVADLSDKMCYILNNNDVRDKIRLNGMKSAKAFYFEKRAETIQDFLNDIVAER
ncbi:MAG: glycosyltransferase family 4 protein [Candidatus Omnitrophota bacterium]|jgi:glycosyltransferase involved in cell wall biosynthesis